MTATEELIKEAKELLDKLTVVVYDLEEKIVNDKQEKLNL